MAPASAPKGYPAAKPSENPEYGLPPAPQYVPPNYAGAYSAASYPVNASAAHPVNAPSAPAAPGCTPSPTPGAPSGVPMNATPSAPPADSNDGLSSALPPPGYPMNTAPSAPPASSSDGLSATLPPAGNPRPPIADFGQPLPQGSVKFAEAGAFSDLMSKIKPVAAAVITRETAAERLVALKEKFNELQKIRARYHSKQIASAAASGGGAFFSLGLSVVAGGAAAVHQRNRLQQVVKAMRQCLEQINRLRAEYASNAPVWDEAEKRVLLDAKAFSKALNRNELHGDY